MLCTAAAPNHALLQIVGVDTEARPRRTRQRPQHPPALLQISSGPVTLLYRLCQLGSVPPLARQLLESPSVLKVGQAIGGDLKMVRAVTRSRWGCRVDLLAMRPAA